MKKGLIALLALALVVSVCSAAPSNATSLQFGTAQPVYGLDATYTVSTADVKSIEVTFADGVEFADSYFEDGQLKISVASATPLDLDEPLAYAVATLTNDSKAAPELVISKLKYDGKATENLIPHQAEAKFSNNTLQVSTRISNDFIGSTYKVQAATYSADGQMLEVTTQEVTFEENEETVSASFTNSERAIAAKIFVADQNYAPVINSTEIQITK